MAWLGLKVLPKKQSVSQEKTDTGMKDLNGETEKANGESECKNSNATNQLEAMEVGDGETVSLPFGELSVLLVCTRPQTEQRSLSGSQNLDHFS